jgi:hypothetical protein
MYGKSFQFAAPLPTFIFPVSVSIPISPLSSTGLFIVQTFDAPLCC